MINREITYERDVNKSYMKIPAVMESSLDEKLMLRKAYQGIVPMEKCYVNGKGQYWYNISGKQALDAYCRVNAINQRFFETLILRICSQLEVLEWNLMDTASLVVDPELIFVNHSGEEISFILYPNTKGNFLDELQELIEYLLTKLNHSDKEGVHQAYRIYEMTLTEGYSISDLKQMILSVREEKNETPAIKPMLAYEESPSSSKSKEDDFKEEMRNKEAVFLIIEKKIQDLVERIKEILATKKAKDEEIPMVVCPDDPMEEEIEHVINPTICLATTLAKSQGLLLHEGIGNYPDFDLGKESCIVGKSSKAGLCINRETISQFHAKIDCSNDTYYIEDMNSTNGTFVNDKMLNYKEKRLLSPGDVLRFADIKYRFL
ncbi:MAG: FHA domain-containing protein [Agathobacter sp.]|nr:FHA domain-containing protein [Agathobacter sp.]